MEVLWLGHADCHDANRAGAKAAHLSRLTAAYRIPPGFCISAAAYAQWAGCTGDGSPASPTASIPPALYNALALAYRDLAGMCSVADPSVAVRSSAVDEDGTILSFAGQYETYLNIVGVDAVAEAIVRCWTSVHTARALAYRQEQGLSAAGVRLAVLVQQLVPADAAAVVFSANPVTGSRDEVVINAGWGLGESIVRGTVTPDTYVLRKADLVVVSRAIAEKRRMTVLAPAGTQEVLVPRRQQKAPSIDDSQVIELARLGIALELAMGWPVDIECAYRGRDLYLLQCRPITTLGIF
jgi:pyruvate, water dikinase